MKSLKIIFTAVLLMFSIGHVNASIIIVSADSNISNGSNSGLFNNVFGNQNVLGLQSGAGWALDNWDAIATANAASYSQTSNLTSTALVGIDWLIATHQTSYSNLTMQLIQNFINGGGNVWVGGEASVFDSWAPANQLLSFLGSSMSLANTSISSLDVTVDSGLSNITSGANANWFANYTSIVNGGTQLYQNDAGQSVLSFETVNVSEPTAFLLMLMGCFIAIRRKAM